MRKKTWTKRMTAQPCSVRGEPRAPPFSSYRANGLLVIRVGDGNCVMGRRPCVPGRPHEPWRWAVCYFTPITRCRHFESLVVTRTADKRFFFFLIIVVRIVIVNPILILIFVRIVIFVVVV
jgi:hypothetical protein